MSIQEDLKQQAIEYGLCEQWQREWGNPTIADLCDKFIRGIDFCIKHNYPTIAYLDKHFRGQVEQYGIYINEGADSKGQAFVVANGDSTIDVYAPIFCDIYARHNSHIRLYASADAFVYVSMYDNCTLEIMNKGQGAKICVSLFGGIITNEDMITKLYRKSKQ